MARTPVKGSSGGLFLSPSALYAESLTGDNYHISLVKHIRYCFRNNAIN